MQTQIKEAVFSGSKLFAILPKYFVNQMKKKKKKKKKKTKKNNNNKKKHTQQFRIFTAH